MVEKKANQWLFVILSRERRGKTSLDEFAFNLAYEDQIIENRINDEHDGFVTDAEEYLSNVSPFWALRWK